MMLMLSSLLPASAGAFDMAKLSFKNESVGIQYTYDGKRISPWHDVPFTLGDAEDGTPLLSFVCEIPRGTREKVEVHKSAEYNDLLQDVKKDGSLRFYTYGDSRTSARSAS